MNEDVNLDEVMSRRFELDEQITAVQAESKARLAPMMEEMALCEGFIKAELLKTGAQQWKSSSTGHMTFCTTKDSVTVDNMDQVIHRILCEAAPPDDLATVARNQNQKMAWEYILGHIERHGLWSLLNKAVNKTVTKELIEAGDQPPGIRYTSFKDLAWRRGKA